MPAPATVHPQLPRFAQAITGVLCLEALIFDTWPVVAVALGLVVLSLIHPRVSPVGYLFRALARPPATLEPAAPVRFAQGMAVAFLSASVVCFAVGVDTAGWVLSGVVTALAIASAVSGICFGCEIYRLLLVRSRQSDDLRRDLGLAGAGPWMVVLTAPGCGRCEPVAQEVERASGQEVVRVNIAENPRAARLPVRSVPAVLAVDENGALRAARAGRLDAEDLRTVLAAAG